MAPNDSEPAGGILAAATKVPIPVRYLLVGLIMGGTWGLQSTPLPLRALTMAGMFLAGPPALHWLRSRLTRGQDRSQGPRASLVRFFGAKGLLVVLAFAGTWLLQPITPHAGLYIGLALAATVAVVGPLLHRHMLIHLAQATAGNRAATVAPRA